MDVPIYTLETRKVSLKATLDDKLGSYYAQGNLVGNFYFHKEPVNLQNIKFIGDFKGVIETTVKSD